MKKILMMAAVVAMALGAQAAYSYNWTININNIASTYQLPSDLKAYLRDGKSGATLAVVSVDMFDQKFNLDLEKANEKAQELGLDTDYQDGGITQGEDPDHAGKILINAFMTYKSNQNLVADYRNTGKPLAIVLEGTNEEGVRLIQTIDVTWNAGTSTDFGGSASYNPVYIPEPSGATLAFLGFVGLMLRRKRAA